jgi:ABC-2 type transport system permease protein
MHWIGLKTLIARECIVTVRFWRVTIAPPMLASILYFTIFGEIIGDRIGPIDGFGYPRYISATLIVLWAVPYAFGHTAAGFLGARLYRYVEELNVSTMPGWLIAAGYTAGGMIRGLLVAIAVGTALALFTPLEFHSFPACLGTLLLACLASSAGGFVTATFAKTFEQVTTIQSLVLTPLTFLGGAFAPLSELPGWAGALSLSNPMFYVIDAFRYGVLGVADVRIGTSCLLVAAFAFVFVSAAFVRANTMRAWLHEG